MLTAFPAMNKLESIGFRLTIEFNHAMLDIPGLQSLHSVTDWLYIKGNSSLRQISGMNALEQVGKDFAIIENDSLMSLQGLNHLQSVGRSFIILSNEVLENFAGLDSVKSVGTLAISNNPKLESIIEMEALEEIKFRLHIVDNPLLDTCSTTYICSYLQGANPVYEISNNNGSCLNRDYIVWSCKGAAQSIDLESQPDLIQIYPNPVKDILIIESQTIEIERVQLFDSMGTLLLDQNYAEGELDISKATCWCIHTFHSDQRSKTEQADCKVLGHYILLHQMD